MIKGLSIQAELSTGSNKSLFNQDSHRRSFDRTKSIRSNQKNENGLTIKIPRELNKKKRNSSKVKRINLLMKPNSDDHYLFPDSFNRNDGLDLSLY